MFGIINFFLDRIWTLYLLFRKKCRVTIEIRVRQYDHTKGLNTCIHPVNELVISIVNTSDLPLTIRDIEFVYYTKGNQAKLSYDNISYPQRSSVFRTTLYKSQEVSFSLSTNDEYEKTVIGELKNIILISSYGHKYEVGLSKTFAAVREVWALPPPHPVNLGLNFEPQGQPIMWAGRFSTKDSGILTGFSNSDS